MFRVGTSGWCYKHWRGVFYPGELPQRRWLEFYTGQFDCTELNASFYRFPLPTTVAGWARRAPGNFAFSIKMNRLITHRRRLVGAEEPLRRFLDLFCSGLAGRLGPFLIQLPPSLEFREATAGAFLGLLGAEWADRRFAVEPRHESWFTAQALAVLERHGIGLVIADSGGCFPGAEAVTAPFVYLRFHGPAGLYTTPYSTAELVTWAERIHEWLAQGLDVWAYFNNDIDGHAVRNARELRELVGKVD